MFAPLSFGPTLAQTAPVERLGAVQRVVEMHVDLAAPLAKVSIEALP